VYDAVVGAGLRPLVELAFTPRALVPTTRRRASATSRARRSGARTRQALVVPSKDYAKWAGLVRALVEHCVARYGAAHVRGWLWELWNEPDILYWRGTPEEFHALYDATAAAVKAALPEAAVGGPTTTGDLGPGRRGNEFLRGFLAHCAKTSAPLDFVSFHTKGARFDPWRVYGPLGGPARGSNLPRASRCCARCGRPWTPWRSIPGSRSSVHRGRVATPRARALGVYDNANFAYRNSEYFPVFQLQADEEALDLSDRSGAHVDPATTWSFYFEGRAASSRAPGASSRSGSGEARPEAVSREPGLGRHPARRSWESCLVPDRLDDGEEGMPEEIDAGHVQWSGLRHRARVAAPPTTSTRRTGETGGHLRVERLPFEGSRVRPPSLAHRWAAQHITPPGTGTGAPRILPRRSFAPIKERPGLEVFEPEREAAIRGGALEGDSFPLPGVSLMRFNRSQNGA